MSYLTSIPKTYYDYRSYMKNKDCCDKSSQLVPGPTGPQGDVGPRGAYGILTTTTGGTEVVSNNLALNPLNLPNTFPSKIISLTPIPNTLYPSQTLFTWSISDT